MKFLLLFFLIIIFNNKIFSQLGHQDFECKYFIEKKYYNHMPINDRNFELGSGTYYSDEDINAFCVKHDSIIDCPYYIFKYNIKNPLIVDSLINRLEKTSVFYSTNDDSLFYSIYRYKQLRIGVGGHSKITIVDSIQKKEFKNKYPIIDFSNYYNELYLPKDYIVYLLDYQSGQILPFDVSPCYYKLPRGLGNGFSYGVAISKKKLEAIYWLIFW